MWIQSRHLLRNGKVTFDEMMEPFFVRTRHNGFRTEMRVFDIFCISWLFAEVQIFEMCDIIMCTRSSSRASWAVACCGKQWKVQFAVSLVLFVSLIWHIKFDQKTKIYKKIKKCEKYPNLYRYSNHILSRTSLSIWKSIFRCILKKWSIRLLDINWVYQ